MDLGILESPTDMRVESHPRGMEVWSLDDSEWRSTLVTLSGKPIGT